MCLYQIVFANYTGNIVGCIWLDYETSCLTELYVYVCAVIWKPSVHHSCVDYHEWYDCQTSHSYNVIDIVVVWCAMLSPQHSITNPSLHITSLYVLYLLMFIWDTTYGAHEFVIHCCQLHQVGVSDVWPMGICPGRDSM